MAAEQHEGGGDDHEERRLAELDLQLVDELSGEELEHGIQHFNMTIPHEHVKQIVDQLDTDHDGKISYAEFARLLHSQEAQSADIFGRSHTERNAVEDPILSFPDPNHVGNAHLHINRHPEMR